MSKKAKRMILIIVLILFGVMAFKVNVDETQFYSLTLLTADVHTPLELEQVSYSSWFSLETEGHYTFSEEEELAMWDEFVSWLNNTTFIKVRGTRGTSYTGEGIYLYFEGEEDRLWIVIGQDGETLKFGDYVWRPIGEIPFPVDEAYLLEMKSEQKNQE